MENPASVAAAAARENGGPVPSTGAGSVVPFLLVVALLLGLVIVLVGIERRTVAIHGQVADVAEPARTEVHNLQRLLALEMAAKRGFLLTGDDRFLDRYQELVYSEGATYQRLEGHAAALGPDVAEKLSELRAFAPQWHAYLPIAQLRVGAPAHDDLADLIAEQKRLYEETLLLAQRLDQAIRQRAEDLRTEVRAIERRERRTVAVIGFLALLTGAVVTWIGGRMRALGERSQRLAAIAESRRRELEQLMEERASFVRGLAHDLKNPVGAVDGYAELLEDGIQGELTPEQKKVVGRIRGAAGQTLGIIEDMLLLSTLTEGHLRVVAQPTDVAQLVRDTVEDHRNLAGQRQLRVSMEVADVPFQITTDPARLRQVVGNLLLNAIKYTPAGDVTVRLYHRARGEADGDGGWVGIEVSDTGLGIPPEEQDRIFEEFHRIHPAQAPGIGLGLAISRRLARLLGGEVMLVRSEVHVGSTFAVRLPEHFPSASGLGRAIPVRTLPEQPARAGAATVG